MTDALVTQTAVEEFVTTNPDAQTTQVAIEHWVSTGTITCQALATMVALEEWVRVDSAATARQYAVTVT
jgi:hypothetical protein